MMRDKDITDNNKGFSLMEIIVAIAIGSIVLTSVMLLVVQGVNNYRTQSTKANLQNDANIALNQMSDNIMEGTCLSMSNLINGDGEIYTSYFKVKDDTKSNNYYVYVPSDKILYLSDNPYKDAASSVLCENVENFYVSILDYSVIVGKENKLEGMTNPIQLRVSIEVAKLNESREANRTISMRNDIQKVELVVDGTDAGVNIVGYDISKLKNYITSEN